MTCRIELDAEQARKHILAAHGNHSRVNWILIENGSRTGRLRSPLPLTGDFSAVHEDFESLQGRGYGILMCANILRESSRRIPHIEAIHNIFVEVEMPLRLPPALPPSMHVAISPRRAQLYWRTSDDDQPTVPEAKAMQRALVLQYGGDANAADVARGLWLAGSSNNAFVVKMISNLSYRYRRSDLLRAFLPPKIEAKFTQDAYVLANWRAVKSELLAAHDGAVKPTLYRSAFRMGQLGVSLDEMLSPLLTLGLGGGLLAQDAVTTIHEGYRAAQNWLERPPG